MSSDPFKNYDRWKLKSPEDERDEAAAKYRRELRDQDRADEMRDREKDEREERRKQ